MKLDSVGVIGGGAWGTALAQTLRLAGRTVTDVHRRGKYLWLALDSGDAVVGHLGMSGQMLLLDASVPAGPHLRVRVTFTDGGPQLRFVDQRTFGGLSLSPGGARLPAEITHIALDPFDRLPRVFGEQLVVAVVYAFPWIGVGPG